MPLKYIESTAHFLLRTDVLISLADVFIPFSDNGYPNRTKSICRKRIQQMLLSGIMMLMAGPVFIGIFSVDSQKCAGKFACVYIAKLSGDVAYLQVGFS